MYTGAYTAGDCLPLINSDFSVPLFTRLFTSFEPLLLSQVNKRPPGPSSLVTARPKRSERVEGAGGGAEAEAETLGLMPGPALDPHLLVLCAPFTQPGPILSLLITGLNVERRTERALDADVSFKAAYYVDIIMPQQLLSLMRSV